MSVSFPTEPSSNVVPQKSMEVHRNPEQNFRDESGTAHNLTFKNAPHLKEDFEQAKKIIQEKGKLIPANKQTAVVQAELSLIKTVETVNKKLAGATPIPVKERLTKEQLKMLKSFQKHSFSNYTKQLKIRVEFLWDKVIVPQLKYKFSKEGLKADFKNNLFTDIAQEIKKKSRKKKGV